MRSLAREGLRVPILSHLSAGRLFISSELWQTESSEGASSSARCMCEAAALLAFIFLIVFE